MEVDSPAKEVPAAKEAEKEGETVTPEKSEGEEKKDTETKTEKEESATPEKKEESAEETPKEEKSTEKSEVIVFLLSVPTLDPSSNLNFCISGWLYFQKYFYKCWEILIWDQR